MAGPLESDGCSWLTPEQVAAKLGLPIETIVAWRTLGHGPPWVLFGDEIRYSEVGFMHWLGGMIGESS
jgi:hypothetical protein